MNHPRSSRLALLASLTMWTGCAGTLPEPIYANQVDAYFPADGAVPIETGEDDEAAVGDVTTSPEGAGEALPPEPTPETDATSPGEVPAIAAVPNLNLRVAAEDCAARLNDHRSTAETVSIIQGVISGFGGAVGGAGGVLSAIDFGNRDITTAMGVMSSIGAGITLIGNLIIGLLANPLEELRLRALGARSWELAVELQFGHADPEAIHASLVRCAADEPPPTRTVGEGPAFSR